MWKLFSLESWNIFKNNNNKFKLPHSGAHPLTIWAWGFVKKKSYRNTGKKLLISFIQTCSTYPIGHKKNYVFFSEMFSSSNFFLWFWNAKLTWNWKNLGGGGVEWPYPRPTPFERVEKQYGWLNTGKKIYPLVILKLSGNNLVEEK